ncbi:SRPBCC family protein [Dyadobacter sp. MSC1_007]|jgi:hypothetical protein|uniref:SRPBCC family protein n=1 Tax=Dyadobacter sp. MSC1_007 TaxID=2909264 RepID=UPI00202EB5CB|nr:hypothetical protein [Dyadobacter sp. MSC1_007]
MESKNAGYSIPTQRILSILIPCLFGWACTYFTTDILRAYSYGLFIWLPFVIGATSTLIYTYKKQSPAKAAKNNAYLTLLTFCIGLLLFAWEGFICLVMAAPIGFPLTYLGYVVAKAFSKSVSANGAHTAGILMFISVPAFMVFDDKNVVIDPIRSVTTSIEINASPEAVWKNVVAFPQLAEPTEFVFKTGIAYPINATIDGQGVGAIRYCNFSTGSFVEPIKVWDEPKLLKFSVEQQPAPMKEISFYDIKPNHLHGYWISKEGQFKLTKLANGGTLLEGTTWYVNKNKPGFYWTIWSDFIVHQIHERVLSHIKVQAEIPTRK